MVILQPVATQVIVAKYSLPVQANVDVKGNHGESKTHGSKSARCSREALLGTRQACPLLRDVEKAQHLFYNPGLTESVQQGQRREM